MNRFQENYSGIYETIDFMYIIVPILTFYK